MSGENPGQVVNAVGAGSESIGHMPPEHLRGRLGVLTTQEIEAKQDLEIRRSDLHNAAEAYAHAKQRVDSIAGEINRTADILAGQVYGSR